MEGLEWPGDKSSLPVNPRYIIHLQFQPPFHKEALPRIFSRNCFADFLLCANNFFCSRILPCVGIDTLGSLLHVCSLAVSCGIINRFANLTFPWWGEYWHCMDILFKSGWRESTRFLTQSGSSHTVTRTQNRLADFLHTVFFLVWQIFVQLFTLWRKMEVPVFSVCVAGGSVYLWVEEIECGTHWYTHSIYSCRIGRLLHTSWNLLPTHTPTRESPELSWEWERNSVLRWCTAHSVVWWSCRRQYTLLAAIQILITENLQAVPLPPPSSSHTVAWWGLLSLYSLSHSSRPHSSPLFADHWAREREREYLHTTQDAPPQDELKIR